MTWREALEYCASAAVTVLDNSDRHWIDVHDRAVTWPHPFPQLRTSSGQLPPFSEDGEPYRKL